MPDSAKSPLQCVIADAVAKSGNTRDYYDGLLRKKLATTGKPLWDIDRGKTKRPTPKTLRAIEDVLGFERNYLVNLVHPDEGSTAGHLPSDADTVGIQHIDQAYGLGATFTDGPVEIEVLQFPKVWVDSITATAPAFLTWTRGKGDSMEPTIHDGDLVLLDRSRRKVDEADALWAFTVGDVGAIKRLRVKGDRFRIMSDNASVPEDEEPIDFVNIVGRVIFVGKRK